MLLRLVRGVSVLIQSARFNPASRTINSEGPLCIQTFTQRPVEASGWGLLCKRIQKIFEKGFRRESLRANRKIAKMKASAFWGKCVPLDSQVLK